MFGRGWMFVFLLGAAFLPYVMSQPTVREALTIPLKLVGQTAPEPKKSASAATAASAESEGESHEDAAPSSETPTMRPAATASRTASATKIVPFEQALQWNVTPAWVMSTWPRVTTALPELELQGYRVPLISGTTEQDIAGSLSYYFDGSQRLVKMTFFGTTGDAQRFVRFLMAHHRFQRRMNQDPSVYLYQVDEDGRALSELRIKTAPIVREGSSLGRFQATLEIRRPAS